MKNMNELSNLQNMKAPSELKQRTLQAARDMRRDELEAGVPQHVAPRTRRRFGPMKRILATACAFGVLAGGATVWKLYTPQGEEASGGNVVVDSLVNTFGFVAYAADDSKVTVPQNSRIVFDDGSGCDDPEKGFYSGCLFRVTGDNIKTVSATMDKCGLYRTKTVAISSDRDAMQAIYNGTSPLLEGADQVNIWGSGPDDALNMYADLCWDLENGFVENYDPDISYGFWASPVPENLDEDEDLQASWHARVDEFDGAKMTVTVTFTDGSTQSQTMTLHSGKLAVEYSAEGERVLTGEVFDNPDDYGKPYVYGIYGEIEQNV